ncbi:Chalcone--flavanone isomerase 1 [Rhodosporidiobolus nylandii]
MPHRHHRAPSDSDPSTDPDSPLSSDDDDLTPSESSTDRHSRHSGSRKKERRRPPSSEEDSEDSESSEGSSEDEKSRRRRHHAAGGGHHRGRRSDSDEESLLEDHHPHRRQKQHRAAAAPPPSSNNLIIGVIIAFTLITLAAGTWWFLHRGSTSSSSTGSNSAESGGGSSASGAASSSTGSAGGGGGGSGQIAGFWENWVGQSISDTKFDKYDIVYWFTAVPGTAEEKGALTMGESTEGQAKEWVTAAKAAGAKAMMTVGGWSGSSTFTKLLATDTSRADFVETLSTALDDYGFDGVDIDWEYPGKAGDTNDCTLLSLPARRVPLTRPRIRTLRAKIGDKYIAADTSAGVWIGADGNPSSDLSEFGEVLDWILIMTYDSITYSSKTTGPNFAYDASCAPSTGSFAIPTTVDAWINAKFPANKILLGLASYGYAWKVADFKDGGGVDGATSSIYQTASENLDAASGSVGWDKIQGNASTMDYTFDKCTSTPFLYSKDTQLFIAYDDADSFAVKGGYAATAGLMGCGIYAGPTQDKEGVLADAARKVC